MVAFLLMVLSLLVAVHHLVVDKNLDLEKELVFLVLFFFLIELHLL